MSDQIPLYIGGLPEHISEADLSSFFVNKGFKISKVVLGRPRNNGRQFAFIYTNAIDAPKIIEQLNYNDIQGREILIMKYNPDLTKKNSDLNIFCRGLAKGTTSKGLNDYFMSCNPRCTIESAKVGRNMNGEILNYGYVSFSRSSESFVKELVSKGSININGSEVSITLFTKKVCKTSNLYLKEFPNGWLAEDISEWIKNSGCEVKSLFIPKSEGGTGNIKGYAFADFGVYQEAINFIVQQCNKNEKEVAQSYPTDDPNFRSNEHNIYISRALSRTERTLQLIKKQKLYKKELKEKTRNKNLYVNNFPEDVDDRKLRQLFSEYGTITSAKVMLDESGKSKSFGFVCFESIDDARKAVLGCKDRPIGNKKLTVCIAESKSLRRRRLSQQYSYNVPHQYPINYPMQPPPHPQIQYNRRFTSFYAPPPQFQQLPQMRNVPMAYPQFPPQHNLPPMVTPAAKIDYNSQLQGKTVEEQRDLLGEIIYKIASKDDQGTAPKITGMLLELDIQELIYHLDFDGMASKIQEARIVLSENKS